MIAESRQLPDAFYSDRDGPYLKRNWMICVFCDYEAADMNRT